VIAPGVTAPRATESGGLRARVSRVPIEQRLAALVLALTVGSLIGTFSESTAGYRIAEAAAVAVSALFSAALAHRVGSRWQVGAGLALALALPATVIAQSVLLTGAAVGTAVVAAVLGVMATRPAVDLRRLTLEVLLAVAIALVGAVAVAGYRAPLDPMRARSSALVLALLGTLALVYRLGAGRHGLGRRGMFALGGGIAALFVVLAYTEALSRWGSSSLRNSADDFISQVDSLLGAVPRPTIFLIGIPALLFGISTRARRRQGWWVQAFGATGLAIAATMFLQAGHPTLRALLSVGYSVALGIFLGGLALLLDRDLSVPGSRCTFATWPRCTTLPMSSPRWSRT
jgi:hypothetical protein